MSRRFSAVIAANPCRATMSSNPFPDRSRTLERLSFYPLVQQEACAGRQVHFVKAIPLDLTK
jgi:hypothetical protein